MVEQPKKTEEGIDDLINRIGKANNHKAIKDIVYDFIDSIDLNDKEKGLLRMTYSDITLTVNELSGAAGFERKPVDQKKSLLSLKEDPELRRHKDQAIAMLKRRFNNQPEKLSTEKTKSSEIETPPITTTSSEQPVIIESKSEAIAEALKSIKEEKEKALEEKITAKLDKFGLTDELDGLKEYQVLSNSQKILALEQLEQLLLEEGEANAEEFVDQGNFLTKHFRSLITNFRGKAHQDVFEKYKEKNNQTGLIKDLTEITKLITNGPDVTRHSNGRYEFIYAGDKLLEGANPSIAKRVAFDLAARNFNKAASDFFNALSNKIHLNKKDLAIKGEEYKKYQSKLKQALIDAGLTRPEAQEKLNEIDRQINSLDSIRKSVEESANNSRGISDEPSNQTPEKVNTSQELWGSTSIRIVLAAAVGFAAGTYLHGDKETKPVAPPTAKSDPAKPTVTKKPAPQPVAAKKSVPQVQVNQPRREPGRTNGTSTNQGNDRHEKFILPPTKTLDHQVSNIYTNQKPDSTTWGTRWPHLDQTKTIKLLGLALGDLNNYTSLLDSIERDRTLNDSHIKHMRDLYKIQHHLQ